MHADSESRGLSGSASAHVATASGVAEAVAPAQLESNRASLGRPVRDEDDGEVEPVKGPLPASQRRSNPAGEGAGGHGVASRGPVLVVDDEPAVRQVAGRMFERLGFEPLLVAGGPEALEVFARDPEVCALAFVDLTMPAMHGTEVLARLRAIRPDLPVVLASGYTAVEVGTEAATAARCVFLPKPFTIAQFEGAVGRALELVRG